MVAIAGALQLVFRPSAYDLLAMLYEQFQAAPQGEHLGLAVHQGQHYGVERGAHGRLAQQVVQHHPRLGVPPQFDDDAHAATVGLVPDVGDALDLALSG